jgi:nuclear pore complex protein Nup62
MYVFTYVWCMYVWCMYLCMYLFVFMYLFICLYVCMYVCIMYVCIDRCATVSTDSVSAVYHGPNKIWKLKK